MELEARRRKIKFSFKRPNIDEVTGGRGAGFLTPFPGLNPRNSRHRLQLQSLVQYITFWFSSFSSLWSIRYDRKTNTITHTHKHTCLSGNVLKVTGVYIFDPFLSFMSLPFLQTYVHMYFHIDVGVLPPSYTRRTPIACALCCFANT